MNATTEGQTVRWFNEFPAAGEPRCICSLCAKPIDQRDQPVRHWRNEPEIGQLEARFCARCYPSVDPLHFEISGSN